LFAKSLQFEDTCTVRYKRIDGYRGIVPELLILGQKRERRGLEINIRRNSSPFVQEAAAAAAKTINVFVTASWDHEKKDYGRRAR
jgi:hypothetical protein